MSNNDKKYVTLYVVSVTKWDPGLRRVRAQQCILHEKIVEAPEAIGPMGWRKNFKRAKLPEVNIGGVICGAADLTEEGAREALHRALLNEHREAQERVRVVDHMISQTTKKKE